MSFASEREAWDSLESMASDEGMASLQHLSLMKMEAEGPTLIAMDDEIVQHVLSDMGANAVPRCGSSISSATWPSGVSDSKCVTAAPVCCSLRPSLSTARPHGQWCSRDCKALVRLGKRRTRPTTFPTIGLLAQCAPWRQPSSIG